MPFIAIPGQYHVVGYSPDGDSVKFEANNNAVWKKVKGTVKQNAKGHVQLRVEAIDALETHYIPKVKGSHTLHQPLTFAQAARDSLLAELGIKNVVWGPKGREVSSADDVVKGYILTREVDSNLNGRPVSFLFTGKCPWPSGKEVFFKRDLIRKSLNYRMFELGMAYPTFYQTMFWDFRAELTNAVKAARRAKRGLWGRGGDKTEGFTFSGLTSITDQYPIFPKLFRRLTEHLAAGGKISTFGTFLAKKKDGLLILPQAHHTDAMDFVVKVSGSRVSMTVLPENLVFDPQG
jgi:hypothetical protein